MEQSTIVLVFHILVTLLDISCCHFVLLQVALVSTAKVHIISLRQIYISKAYFTVTMQVWVKNKIDPIQRDAKRKENPEKNSDLFRPKSNKLYLLYAIPAY